MANVKIRPRRDTTANWNSYNPVLADGEMGFEIIGTGQPLKLKIGDGNTAWTGLTYAVDFPSIQSAASTASNAASAASTSSANAKTSETNAKASETNAASSASAASTSASNASSSASAASSSATNASSSASAAASSASAASSSASAADSAKTAAASSASEAATSASNAASSATAAANSAASLTVVNDLTTGGTTNALSAEQGKVLSTSISTLATQTSFSLKTLASVEADSHTADGSQTFGNYYKTFRWDMPTAGTKHYVRASILVPNECTQVSSYIYNGASVDYAMEPKAPSVKNSFYSFSGVVTQSATATASSILYIRHYYPDAATANGKVMQIQYISVIDLTAAFGAGNEPTANEMDVLLALFPNSWFNGTITLTQKQILIWTLNLIRKNTNAIIAMGGTIA